MLGVERKITGVIECSPRVDFLSDPHKIKNRNLCHFDTIEFRDRMIESAWISRPPAREANRTAS